MEAMSGFESPTRLLGAGVRLFDHLANTPVVLGNPTVVTGVGIASALSRALGLPSSDIPEHSGTRVRLCSGAPRGRPPGDVATKAVAAVLPAPAG